MRPTLLLLKNKHNWQRFVCFLQDSIAVNSFSAPLPYRCSGVPDSRNSLLTPSTRSVSVLCQKTVAAVNSQRILDQVMVIWPTLQTNRQQNTENSHSLIDTVLKSVKSYHTQLEQRTMHVMLLFLKIIYPLLPITVVQLWKFWYTLGCTIHPVDKHWPKQTTDILIKRKFKLSGNLIYWTWTLTKIWAQTHLRNLHTNILSVAFS